MKKDKNNINCNTLSEIIKRCREKSSKVTMWSFNESDIIKGNLEDHAMDLENIANQLEKLIT